MVKQGVIFAYDGYNNGNNVPRYSFTKLNSIKPEMLSEATAEAKKAANEFALNSGSEIGKIKSANQGVFTVFSQEEASGDKMLSMASNAGSQYGDEGFYLEKMVRVVISVDYYLKN